MALIDGKEAASQRRRCKRYGFDPWVEKIPWRMAWQPTQHSCLENPMDRGAWLATVYRVAKSQTQLKRLSTAHIPLYKRVWFGIPVLIIC